jgi:diguanylate cyclase
MLKIWGNVPIAAVNVAELCACLPCRRPGLNYSLIPDFIAISGLVLVFGSLLRHSRQTRLRSWLIGWILILVHIVAQIVNSALPPGKAADAALAVSLAMLLLTAITFIWAGNDRQTARLKDLYLMLLASVPEVVLFGCLVYDVQSTGTYLALTALGVMTTLWVFRGKQKGAQGFQRLARVLGVAVVYSVQAILVLRESFDLILVWILFSYYVGVAFFFWHRAPRFTVGVVFTTISFVAWASVFPMAYLLQTYLPAVHLDNEVWNLPKFLVATGMIFTLLEEKMGQAEYASLHDSLTDLPNRRMFVRELEAALTEARGSARRVALLILDLDGFKEINDRYGHAVGDALLQSVAQRLQSHMREGDVLARMGGDEFAAILTSMSHRAAVERIAHKLATALESEVECQGFRLSISVSVGLALSPEDGDDELQLYANADRSMYEHKLVNRTRSAAGGPLSGQPHGAVSPQ